MAPNTEDRDALMRLTLDANLGPVTSISILSVSDISGLATSSYSTTPGGGGALQLQYSSLGSRGRAGTR